MRKLVVLISGLALLLLFLQFTVTEAQTPPTADFISIICGLPKDQAYNDSRGLLYISDSEFVETGESKTISEEYSVSNSSRNYLRIFPKGTRNCYDIKPGLEDRTYLVRARFLYGNYDGRGKFPIFDVYIGINYWATIPAGVGLGVNYDMEILVVISNSISICLVKTNDGIPFVSAIELRLLPDSLYSEANTSQSLVLLARSNLGGSFSRYPNDIYDRFWSSDPSGSIFTAAKSDSSIFSVTTSLTFKEPEDVMKSYVFPDETTTSVLNATLRVTSVGAACPSTRAFFVFYFADETSLGSDDSRILSVSVDDVLIFDNIKPVGQVSTPFAKSVSLNGDQLSFSVANIQVSTGTKTAFPFLNALEVYRIIDMTCQSETQRLVVDALMDLKSFYKVQRNWYGDPCAPMAFMWEGLNCTYNKSSIPLVTSLNLSTSGLTGEIPAFLANLSALKYLDLSGNHLTGEVPDSLSKLGQLKVLNLANNNLTGSIPKVLLQMSKNGKLDLRTQGNSNLCSNPDICIEEEGVKKNSRYLVVLASVVSCLVLLLGLVLVVILGTKSVEITDPNIIKFTWWKLIWIIGIRKVKIGSGGFSDVFLGKYGEVKVAVKMLKNLNQSKGFQAEINTFENVRHKNLMKLIGYCDHVNHLALVSKFMDGGSLEDYLSGSKVGLLSWDACLRIALEVAEGLKYLHTSCEPPIIHRDIKPGNILLTNDLKACIADFGLCKLFENYTNATHMSLTPVAGTLGYVDPEYIDNKVLREKSDVYSFGVVLLQLLTRLQPYTHGNMHITHFVSTTNIKEFIIGRKEKYDEKSVNDFVELAKKCTENISQNRPDMTKVAEGLKKIYDTLKTSDTTGVNQEQPAGREDEQSAGTDDITENESDTSRLMDEATMNSSSGS